MVQDKQEIFGLLRGREDKIRSLGVKRLGLFGSFARGKQSLKGWEGFGVQAANGNALG